MYTIESLKSINARYIYHPHQLSQSDVDMANKWVQQIELERDNIVTPMAGDTIQLTDKHGGYYPCALIQRVDEDGDAEVCENAYTPFLHKRNDGSVGMSASGGAWRRIQTAKLKHIGKTTRLFCDWGSCGACADGAVAFEAEVNLWEYADENPLYGNYTMKDWRRDYISFCEKERDGSPYHYVGNFHAYKTELEYMAWLTTYRGVEFVGNWPNQTVVFFYKKDEHLISKDEWDALNLLTDTRLMNGGVQLIKYFCDDETHTVHEYRFNNTGELDWRANRPYRVALQLLEKGYTRTILPSEVVKL